MQQNQTKVINQSERIRISRQCKGDQIETNFFPELEHQTLHCLFQRGYNLSRHLPCLGSREPQGKVYKWKTYHEVKQLYEYIGSALIKQGNIPGNSEKVGIYGVNRWEWDVTQLACNAYSFVTVPLYDTLGVDAISYIMSITDMKTVICDNEEKVLRILSSHKDCPELKLIITMDQISSDVTSKVKNAGIDIYSFSNFIKLGKDNFRSPQPPTSSDTLTLILFTSGTTGQPKGVMLTNKNMVTCVGAMIEHYNDIAVPSNDETVISYLPQAHGFNQVLTQCMLSYGARVGYLSGSVFQLLDDLKILKPTLFPIVPRLLNRIYDRVWQQASKSTIRRRLLKKAYSAKKRQMATGGLVHGDIWDRVVFKKVQKLLGGKVKGMLTGSAPVSSEVLTFVRCAVGCEILEGYGQTETTAPSTCTLPGDCNPGHVGVPLKCCEIKLVDVPEMNYYSSNDKGEVCFRGPHCFVGYWKDEENTSATIDEDGWVHSGDVGMWTDEGTLKLVDRKKNIFKLAQGEYIAPEKIEGIYVQCPTVAQIYVHGDSLETCCVAIVVPEESVLRDVCDNLGIQEKNWNEICNNKQVKQFVLKEILAKGSQNKLNKLEQVKSIFLWTQQFTIENDLLTPTMKSKRPQLRTKFVNEIKMMYEEIAASETKK